MPRTRRLADLYVTGREFIFDDDDGENEPVTVYIRKLTPVDNEQVMRRANAARAAMLVARRDRDSQEYKNLYSQVWDVGDTDSLVDQLISPELIKKRIAREAEIAFTDEWNKDSYLQGLKDAWNDGLSDKYQENPDDLEAKRVFDELQRFEDAVTQAMKGEDEAIRRSFESKTEEELREKVLDQILELQSDVTWMSEYRKSELWLAVRDPKNRRERYFVSRDEVDELSYEMLKRLTEAYQSMSVDLTEGKDSRPTDSSSEQPEPPSPQETEDSSGPQIVLA